MKIWIQRLAALSLVVGLAGCALFGPPPPTKVEDRIDLVLDQLGRIGKDYVRLGGKCEFGACTPPVQINLQPGDNTAREIGIQLVCMRVPGDCCIASCGLPMKTEAYQQCVRACSEPTASTPAASDPLRR